MKEDKEDDFQFNIDYHKEDKEDFPEDIPYSENWKRVNVDDLKHDFNQDFNHYLKQDLKQTLRLCLDCVGIL